MTGTPNDPRWQTSRDAALNTASMLIGGMDTAYTRDSIKTARELVIDLVVAWETGRITLAEVRDRCTPQERFVAVAMTRPDDPAHGPLMALLDALIAEDDRDHGIWRSKHGPITVEMVIEAGAKIVGNLLRFPVAWPFRRQPDPKTGFPGERGEPIYRAQDERGPVITQFGAAATQEQPTKGISHEWFE